MKFVLLFVLLVPLLVVSAHNAQETGFQRPDPNNARAMARWLVASNSWGVISTISLHLGGAPWGNIASFSDGPEGNATGTPYFYLSRMDPTPLDIEADPRCSLCLSEAPIGTCGTKDAENPTCARLTLSGKMVELSKEGDEGRYALEALYSKHPEMKAWPKDHDWRIYKLQIDNIFLVDYFGGAKRITVEEYYSTVKAVTLSTAM
ncbi:hypothetical protein R1sor_025029 [Riccia sorocarpa]|uniref:CREG-like beta-barrel domain-containing protein n=1 Tax=Riccia sorocarpa TaxID=122646 RepID=A0ABD3G8R8_9MARC